MIALAAALLVGLGLAILAIAVIQRGRERHADLAVLLDLPYGEADAHAEELADEDASFFEPGIAAVNAALERLDLSQRLALELSRARVPLRPGEFVLVAFAAAVAGGLAAGLLSGQWLVGVITLAGLSWGAWAAVVARSAKRRKSFEQQLPEALSLIASSLEAGHTFLRSVEMMVEEAEPPLSEEFERIITEVQLGGNLVDAMERLADRLQISDLSWVVQAIRIQQTVGGKLAELLMTLAGFMRAREEIRREVQVLTAEGRMSARVLGLLPVAVFVVIKTMNPDYLQPMLSGGGLVALIGAGISVLVGMAVIKRMARIDV